VSQEKLKFKVKCFRESENLFNSQKYEYESFLRTISYIVFGFGNNEKEKVIEGKLENQILKNETTPLKSVTPAVLEEKQNFGNETNVETKCLQSPSKKWYEQLTESEQKKQKENETNIIKTKEKITLVLEEKKMLEKIEKILYQSGPSSFKKTSSQFNEILASTKRSEYKSLVCMFIKDLVNTNDPEMISRIKTFLETKDFLSASNKLFIHQK